MPGTQRARPSARSHDMGEIRPQVSTEEIRPLGPQVGDVGPAVRALDAQVGEQLGHGLRGRYRPPIGVEGELARLDPLALAALGDQPGA